MREFRGRSARTPSSKAALDAHDGFSSQANGLGESTIRRQRRSSLSSLRLHHLAGRRPQQFLTPFFTNGKSCAAPELFAHPKTPWTQGIDFKRPLMIPRRKGLERWPRTRSRGACNIGQCRVSVRIIGPDSIVIRGSWRSPIIQVGGDIGANSSDQCKRYAVAGALNLKTALVR